jgi:hypothetical protein
VSLLLLLLSLFSLLPGVVVLDLDLAGLDDAINNNNDDDDDDAMLCT